MWLEKAGEKKEKRPRLSTLKTAEEISYWLPSIKKELDFFLKQMEVPCYTDQKIGECRKHIHYLEMEYRAFVRKLKQSSSELKSIPWTARPYERKIKDNSKYLSLHPVGEASAIPMETLVTPVLLHDHLYQDCSGCEDTKSQIETFRKASDQSYTGKETLKNDVCLFQNERRENPEAFTIEKEQPLLMDTSCSSKRRSNLLNLDYSSSDDS